MKAFSLRVIALASLPAFGACADTGTNAPTGPGFEITVAPLQLVGIADACYDILVENSTPDGLAAAANNVVSLTNICSSQYGNNVGGDITYIATCDASVATNWVTVWPKLLGADNTNLPADGDTDLDVLTDWENPCGTAGCQLERPCQENEDTLVEFNFTIMREADQGFFDVAVNFSDVFCSAKVDCQYDGGEWIRLVHGDNGVRTASAVVAFACTDGNDAGSPGATNLYTSNVTVTCDDDGAGANPPVVYQVPTNVAGNLYTMPGGNPNGPIEQAIVFMGTEDLQVNGTNAGKVYWNTAIGFDETGTTGQPQLGAIGANCTLTFTGTASEGPLNLAAGTSFLSYPFVQASVTLTDGTGAMTCSQHPLDSTSFSIAYGNTIPAAIDYRATGVEADAGTAITLP